MLPAAGNAPRDVLAVLRAHAAGTAGEDGLLAVGAQPLPGGRNNVAYRWESSSGPVCAETGVALAVAAARATSAWSWRHWPG